MMRQPRKFESQEIVKMAVPNIIGLSGPSCSGKTYTALRLATGIQKVTGGTICMIDTEGGRGAHYGPAFGGPFVYRYLPFPAPHEPLDYLDAFNAMIAEGHKVIIIDSMTNEHVACMDMSERYLDRYGDDEKQRQKNFVASLKEPYAHRAKLNARLVQSGASVICCYRAKENIKPVTGQGIQNFGWKPETTSKLYYDMTLRLMFQPGSDGRPDINPVNPAEKLLVKLPEQFRHGFFKDGEQITEAHGEMLARWAAGDGLNGTKTVSAPAQTTADAESERNNQILRATKSEITSLRTAMGPTSDLFAKWKGIIGNGLKEADFATADNWLTGIKADIAAVKQPESASDTPPADYQFTAQERTDEEDIDPGDMGEGGWAEGQAAIEAAVARNDLEMPVEAPDYADLRQQAYNIAKDKLPVYSLRKAWFEECGSTDGTANKLPDARLVEAVRLLKEMP